MWGKGYSFGIFSLSLEGEGVFAKSALREVEEKPEKNVPKGEKRFHRGRKEVTKKRKNHGVALHSRGSLKYLKKI